MLREISKSQRDWLEGEFAHWQSLGLIEPDRAQALLGIYESKEAFEARKQAKGQFTLLAVAAFFVGLGVLLLIGYNWADMPASIKVAAIFGALIGTHTSGYQLRYRFGLQTFSEIVFFLGSLFYGSGMALLGQIFHVNSGNYDLLWWWALGVIPFALILQTTLLHMLVAGLLAIWVGYEVISIDRFFMGIPSGGASLPLMIVPGLWWGYRTNSARTIAIYLPVLVFWIILQPIAWRVNANPIYFLGASGAMLFVAAAFHAKGSAFALPYRFWGITLVSLTLAPLSFHAFSRNIHLLDAQRKWNAFGGLIQVGLIVGLATLVMILGYFLRKRFSEQGSVRSIGDTLIGLTKEQTFPHLLLGFYLVSAVWEPATSDAWVPTILANFAMIGLSAWLIRLGLAEDRSRPFGVGVVYMLFWAFLRYLDLFGEMGGMLGAALMFFLSGGLLFGVVLYWRNRKETSHV